MRNGENIREIMHAVIDWHRSGDNRVWHWTHRQAMSGSRRTIELPE